jgi:hypothetical protein
MVIPIINKKIALSYEVPMDYPAVFSKSIKNIENEKENLQKMCSESDLRLKKSLKLQEQNRPLWCGSCQAEQDPEYDGVYCHSCKKDAWYGSHKPYEKPVKTVSLSELTEHYRDSKSTKMKFCVVASDYDDYLLFKEYMKLKTLSLQDKNAVRRTEERKE